jgi:hypothetical protein
MGSNEKGEKLSQYHRSAQAAPLDPPPYSEVDSNSRPDATPDYNSLQGQNQTYPDEKKSGSSSQQPYGRPDGPPHGLSYGHPPQQYGDYPPDQYGKPHGNAPPPGVYLVPKLEETVNIANARPDQVNPAYQDYLAADQHRLAMGNFPNNYKKPLAPRKVDRTNKSGGGAFPGRSGASYYDAANK